MPQPLAVSYEITQGPGVLALRSEMIHDARIFSTDGAPHISPVIRQYHGDSRSRWDGDTLVVDTTNYVANATRVGASDKLRTVETFRRVADDSSSTTSRSTTRLCGHGPGR